jgi:DNA polymerase-3 subunit alpha
LTSISSLDTLKNGGYFAIGGILNSKKIKKDKKGRNYAIINIEDFDGAIDVFIFSENFEKYAPVLKVDIPLIIKGRVSGEEDRKSISAETIILMEAAKKYYSKIFIDCEKDKLAQGDLQQLYEILNNNQGECEVWFKVNGKSDCKNLRSRSLKINPTAEVLDKIKNIVGDMSLRIYGKIQ